MNTNSKQETKERIIEAAFELFSEKGYDGVGVDQIAERIGFKGPSIYKHFKGKEAVLDALMEKIDKHYNENFGNMEHLPVIPNSMEELIELGMKQINFSIHDQAIVKVRKMLAMEQFRSPEIARSTTMHHLTGIENMFTYIFTKMMENNIIVKEDPNLLAFEYVAPISMLVHVCDREPDKEEEVKQRIRQHMEHFAKIYGVKKK